MRCPECGAQSQVRETREVPAGIRRRRFCVNGHRFTTYEQVFASGGARHDDTMVFVPRRLLLDAVNKTTRLLANLIKADESVPERLDDERIG